VTKKKKFIAKERDLDLSTIVNSNQQLGCDSVEIPVESNSNLQTIKFDLSNKSTKPSQSQQEIILNVTKVR